MKTILLYLLIALIFIGTESFANNTDENFSYTKTVNKPLNAVYDSVYTSLENEKFWIIFEANMGKNLASFEKHWGEDYNKNKLENIRSLMFCNPWYANQVSNLDPTMLAICPLNATLFEKDGKTTILFIRPSLIAKDSPAKNILAEVEKIIIDAIEKGMK